MSTKPGSEDFLFNFQAYMCANKIEVLDEPLYYYDLREGSLSQSYKSGLDKKFTVLYTTLLEWIHEHNYTRVCISLRFIHALYIYVRV